ncbi:Vitamin B12 dependent methionine synthase, activation domain [Lutibacter agarilyticus]|uniref:Vitamin B12 dependent methionine synthase, activation domain n=1 Tax=Lutibacter agarilyticus TaxID=1109740 RepID=A0A238VBT6_9FLAO|nr:vitamin B12 dependent-methionine synthase activation domain-containing protein [Lutibacter agarilyticus]SNR31133.1 Vitamin B12 dependent methionine synthase, activation domain [Lutibacter agarilyticus]
MKNNMKGTYSYKLDFADIKLEKAEISAFMGLGEIPDEPFGSMIDIAIELLSTNKNIEGGFVIKPVSEVSIKEGTITIENETFTTGKMISSFLKNSEYAALFTCTAGFEVEKYSNQYKNEGDFVQSYVIDATGSLLVEGAMELIYEKLQQMATLNYLNLTNRYSPGYCEWKVVDQQKLFSFLPSKFCNVSLSESSLMSPVKSVSGIVGIGKNVKYLGYICDSCKSLGCVYRAKKMYVKH